MNSKPVTMNSKPVTMNSKPVTMNSHYLIITTRIVLAANMYTPSIGIRVNAFDGIFFNRPARVRL
jgi:hypothetical protein